MKFLDGKPKRTETALKSFMAWKGPDLPIWCGLYNAPNVKSRTTFSEILSNFHGIRMFRLGRTLDFLWKRNKSSNFSRKKNNLKSRKKIFKFKITVHSWNCNRKTVSEVIIDDLHVADVLDRIRFFLCSANTPGRYEFGRGICSLARINFNQERKNAFLMNLIRYL